MWPKNGRLLGLLAILALVTSSFAQFNPHIPNSPSTSSSTNNFNNDNNNFEASPGRASRSGNLGDFGQSTDRNAATGFGSQKISNGPLVTGFTNDRPIIRDNSIDSLSNNVGNSFNPFSDQPRSNDDGFNRDPSQSDQFNRLQGSFDTTAGRNDGKFDKSNGNTVNNNVLKSFRNNQLDKGVPQMDISQVENSMDQANSGRGLFDNFGNGPNVGGNNRLRQSSRKSGNPSRLNNLNDENGIKNEVNPDENLEQSLSSPWRKTRNIGRIGNGSPEDSSNFRSSLNPIDQAVNPGFDMPSTISARKNRQQKSDKVQSVDVPFSTRRGRPGNNSRQALNQIGQENTDSLLLTSSPNDAIDSRRTQFKGDDAVPRSKSTRNSSSKQRMNQSQQQGNEAKSRDSSRRLRTQNDATLRNVGKQGSLSRNSQQIRNSPKKVDTVETIPSNPRGPEDTPRPNSLAVLDNSPKPGARQPQLSEPTNSMNSKAPNQSKSGVRQSRSKGPNTTNVANSKASNQSKSGARQSQSKGPNSSNFLNSIAPKQPVSGARQPQPNGLDRVTTNFMTSKSPNQPNSGARQPQQKGPNNPIPNAMTSKSPSQPNSGPKQLNSQASGNMQQSSNGNGNGFNNARPVMNNQPNSKPPTPNTSNSRVFQNNPNGNVPKGGFFSRLTSGNTENQVPPATTISLPTLPATRPKLDNAVASSEKKPHRNSGPKLIMPIFGKTSPPVGVMPKSDNSQPFLEGGFKKVETISPEVHKKRLPTIRLDNPLDIDKSADVPKPGSGPMEAEVRGTRSIIINTGRKEQYDWVPSNVVIPLIETLPEDGGVQEEGGEMSTESHAESKKPMPEKRFPGIITSPTPIDIHTKKLLPADIKLNIPFVTFIQDSTLTAQAFSILPGELSDSLNLPSDQFQVIQLREDLNDDTATIVSIAFNDDSASGGAGEENNEGKLKRLNDLVQSGDSNLYTNSNHAFSRFLDPGFPVTRAESFTAADQEHSLWSLGGDQHPGSYYWMLAVSISGVLYFLLIGGIAMAWWRASRERKRALSEQISTV